MRENRQPVPWSERVFVDTYAGAMGEAGDILQAINEGCVQVNQPARRLAELIQRRQAPGARMTRPINAVQIRGRLAGRPCRAIEVWETLENN